MAGYGDVDVRPEFERVLVANPALLVKHYTRCIERPHCGTALSLKLRHAVRSVMSGCAALT